MLYKAIVKQAMPGLCAAETLCKRYSTPNSM